MIPFFYFCLVAVGCLLAHRNWRAGLFLMLLAGVLQDPVRKMMAGAPGYMVLAFTPIWFVICVRVLLPNFSHWKHFGQIFPRVNQQVMILLLALTLAFLVLLVNYGLDAWMVGVIGAIGYTFPLLAMVVGFFLIRSGKEFDRLAWSYALFISVILVSGWLDYLGTFADWKMLGTGALGNTWVRYVTGYLVELNSGFFRSPELLGWHSAILVMLATVMVIRGRTPSAKAAWILFAVFGTLTVLISGRNKMIFMPIVFLGVVTLCFTYKSNVHRLASIALSALVTGLVFSIVFALVNLDREYTRYIEYGTGYASERLSQSTVGAVVTTFEQSGFFGEGLGTASLGKRYAGLPDLETWQESGLSRLLVELGVPGSLAAAALFLALLRTLIRLLKGMPRASPLLPVYAGLLGILAANGASFLISHQIFGDPFIIVLTGLLLGIALSAPFWPENDQHTGTPN